MIYRLRVQLTLSALGLSLWRTGVATTPLRIAFDAASPPTMYVNPHGEAAGVYPALVRHAFELMGEQAEWVPEPFRRLIGELFNGTAAAGAVVRNEERLAVADYSEDYFVEHLRVFRRGGTQTLRPGIDGLRGLRIGVVRGWSYGDAFDQARSKGVFYAEEVVSDAKNFAKLRLGRLDAVVATDMAARMLLPASNDQGGTVISAQPQALLSIGIALALPKNLAAPSLLRRFNDAIAAMRREGLIDTIAATEVERARQAFNTTV